ncbi:hypothetical protein ABBQ32_007535 [Trebouxia sp. C0010 RCD-2024]
MTLQTRSSLTWVFSRLWTYVHLAAGSMITESYRKRRASDVDESTVSSKRSKASTECSTAPSLQCAEQYLAEVLDTSEKLSDAADASQTAGCCNGHTAMPKENRSPNLNFLDCFEAELDNYNDLNQATSLEEAAAAPTDSSDGLLNLLLLADSSLQDCISDPSMDMPDEPEAATEQWSSDVMHSDAEDSGSLSMSLQTSEEQLSTADASKQHPSAAGLRPTVIAQTAAMMSANMGMDSDSSSSSDEEEPAPVKRHKGMGRYGQELGNIAAQALRQTNLLKKKCTNRTNKTVRQLRTASAPNCEAAEKAVEATTAAEKAVQNLAAFADAFDDLVKEAVRTANAAAQSRADYAASVVAAELAEARRDRVASKRAKRRSSPPKTPKRLAWAADEHLVQHRVFSTADPPSAASFNCAAAK